MSASVLARAAVCAAALGGVLAASGCSMAGGAGVSSNDPAVLVSADCSRCHPIDRVNAARKSRDQWIATVSRMRAHGLQVTDQQAAAIVSYLAKRDGGS